VGEKRKKKYSVDRAALREGNEERHLLKKPERKEISGEKCPYHVGKGGESLSEREREEGRVFLLRRTSCGGRRKGVVLSQRERVYDLERKPYLQSHGRGGTDYLREGGESL